MPVLIPDDVLRASGMDEREAKVEIACRLFDAGKLTIGHASRLAGVDEIEFERQLQQRGIPRFRVTDKMVEDDIQTLKKLGRW